MHSIRVVLVFLLCFVLFNSFGQEVKCTVHGFKGKTVYLASVKGGKKTKIDSALVFNGSFTFSRNKTLPLGMYRIFFNDSVYTDVIINKEAVVLDCVYDNLIASMHVLQSDENKVFYNYLQRTMESDYKMEPLLEKGRKLYKEGIAKNKKQLDSLKNLIDSINVQEALFTSRLIDDNKNLFASHIIRTLQVPSYTQYKAHADTVKYRNEKEFLREHFFDNINFNDTTLLYTEYIYQACSEYLTGYAKPPSNEAFIKASDFILSKAKVNKIMYDYVLNLLVQTFESSDWEQAFVYITEKYYLDSSCEGNSDTKSLAEKAAAIKKLAIGNPAPPLALPDASGKLVNMYELQQPYVLLIFWSSICTHCEEMLPQLKPLIEKYVADKTLAVYAVSMDVDKAAWLNAVKKINAGDWIFVNDLKGFGSETALKYNVWHTPAYYILNKEKKIVARPYTNQQVIAKFSELLK